MISRLLLATVIVVNVGISVPTVVYNVGSVIEVDVLDLPTTKNKCSVCFSSPRSPWLCSVRELPTALLIPVDDSGRGLAISVECNGVRWGRQWTEDGRPSLTRVVYKGSDGERLQLTSLQQFILSIISTVILLLVVADILLPSSQGLPRPHTPVAWTVIVHVQGRIKTAHVPPGFALTRAALDEFVRKNPPRVAYAALCS
ncbi:hypothetical protein FOZ62_031360 [Perkinsus olseni]|uniref:Uncharacterized protein n=1 Tax=Perkinsus olseni TaxID=32597 RepID=A0A7J6R6Z2_PEROL|nr:hypothetical protein FOZ62_031360 [Perkinsus olseni]